MKVFSMVNLEDEVAEKKRTNHPFPWVAMKSFKRLCKVHPGLIAAIIVTNVAAQQITITKSTEYQTIDGLGATWKPSQPSATAAAMHDTLGASFIRIQTCAHALGMDTDTSMSDSNPAHNSAMTALCNGIAANRLAYPDFNFVISIMSPPTWMKDTTRDRSATCTDGQGQCGGHLRADMRTAFSQNVVVILKEFKRLSGVDIYALSLQNEPSFMEWYVSCVYTVPDYDTTFRILAAQVKKAGLTTRLIGAEDMTAQFSNRPYIQTILQDTGSRPYLYATATHGYNDNGVNPNAGTITMWNNIKTVAKNFSKKVWMSETSGYPDDWATALGYADAIYVGLNYGQCSGWIWDTDGGSSCDNNYALMCNNGSTNRSLVTRNFYAFIRPGAVGVGAVSADTSIHVVAFNQKTNRTLAIVCVNQGAAKTFTLAGAGLPANFTKYTTTSAKRCANEGTVASSGSLSLDAGSVTTLIGTYTAGVRTGTGRTAQLSNRAGKAQLFGIDGRYYRDITVAAGHLVIERSTDGSSSIKLNLRHD